MLLLESDIYGYYIHGQSVHGKADTGLRQMHENMVQEEVCTAGWPNITPGDIIPSQRLHRRENLPGGNSMGWLIQDPSTWVGYGQEYGWS